MFTGETADPDLVNTIYAGRVPADDVSSYSFSPPFRQRCGAVFLFVITKNEQFLSLFDQLYSNDAVNLTSCAGSVVIRSFFVYDLCVVGNNYIIDWEGLSVKKFIAFMCALVLVCSIAAVTLASCSHGNKQLCYTTTIRNWTSPRWTNCAYNPSMHAHTLRYREKVYVYYCPTCNKVYEDHVTEFVSETCPCAH